MYVNKEQPLTQNTFFLTNCVFNSVRPHLLSNTIHYLWLCGVRVAFHFPFAQFQFQFENSIPVPVPMSRHDSSSGSVPLFWGPVPVFPVPFRLFQFLYYQLPFFLVIWESNPGPAARGFRYRHVPFFLIARRKPSQPA